MRKHRSRIFSIEDKNAPAAWRRGLEKGLLRALRSPRLVDIVVHDPLPGFLQRLRAGAPTGKIGGKFSETNHRSMTDKDKDNPAKSAPPSSGKPKAGNSAGSRDDRLAEALRANLRRRKTAAKKPSKSS